MDDVSFSSVLAEMSNFATVGTPPEPSLTSKRAHAFRRPDLTVPAGRTTTNWEGAFDALKYTCYG